MKQLVTDRSYSINTPPPTFFNLIITDAEFELFRKLIYNKSGINLSPEKKSLIQTRLIKRLHLRNCETFSQYYRYIKNDAAGEEMIAMLNAISTNLTKFFREEAHSLCITVLRHIDTPLVWNIKILATDISTDILQMAAEGIYEIDKISNLPKELLNEYFVKDNAGYNNCYKVTPLLRDIITFRRLNLIDETYPFKGKFDFIFCRNVMIYFDKKTQEGIVNRFYNHLDDGGYLFIGHSESLNGVKSPFKYELPAVYRKGAVLK